MTFLTWCSIWRNSLKWELHSFFASNNCLCSTTKTTLWLSAKEQHVAGIRLGQKLPSSCIFSSRLSATKNEAHTCYHNAADILDWWLWQQSLGLMIMTTDVLDWWLRQQTSWIDDYDNRRLGLMIMTTDILDWWLWQQTSWIVDYDTGLLPGQGRQRYLQSVGDQRLNNSYSAAIYRATAWTVIVLMTSAVTWVCYCLY